MTNPRVTEFFTLTAANQRTTNCGNIQVITTSLGSTGKNCQIQDQYMLLVWNSTIFAGATVLNIGPRIMNSFKIPGQVLLCGRPPTPREYRAPLLRSSFYINRSPLGREASSGHLSIWGSMQSRKTLELAIVCSGVIAWLCSTIHHLKGAELDLPSLLQCTVYSSSNAVNCVSIAAGR